MTGGITGSAVLPDGISLLRTVTSGVSFCRGRFSGALFTETWSPFALDHILSAAFSLGADTLPSAFSVRSARILMPLSAFPAEPVPDAAGEEGSGCVGSAASPQSGHTVRAKAHRLAARSPRILFETFFLPIMIPLPLFTLITVSCRRRPPRHPDRTPRPGPASAPAGVHQRSL